MSDKNILLRLAGRDDKSRNPVYEKGVTVPTLESGRQEGKRYFPYGRLKQSERS